jgi:toxin FitB
VSHLVDTNVLSELRRRTPDPQVVRWFSQRARSTLYLSVLTLGEISKGIGGLGNTPRRLALVNWLESDLPTFFSGRVLGIDAAVADRWGQLLSVAGRPLPAIDSLLVATALRHGLSLVTRNVRDVQGLGVQVINPWQAVN